MGEKRTDSSTVEQLAKETSQTLRNEELQELINSTAWVFRQGWKSQLSADRCSVLNGGRGNTDVSCTNGSNIVYFFVVHFLLIVQRQKLCLLQTHVNQLLPSKESIDVWLSPQDQYLSLPSRCFPDLLFGKISIPSSWTVRWMQKCARAYLQLSCLKEQLRTFTSTWVFCIYVVFLSTCPDRLFLTELKPVLDPALKYTNKLVGKTLFIFQDFCYSRE